MTAAAKREAGTIVGREEELRLFGQAFDRMLEGRRQVVVLAGMPGIGKTRCAEKFAALSEDRGALVLWGRCYEEPGAPPYWPWLQIVREYLASASPTEVRMMLGSQLREIAAIMPELDDDAQWQMDKSEAPAIRFRAFDAISRLLEKAASSVPIVIVLDDMHWADKPSLALLEFVSRALASTRLLVVGTYRDNEVARNNPLLATLGELGREDSLRRVPLRGLSRNAIASLARHCLDGELPEAAIRAIAAQTDGNPLFVTELMKVLADEQLAYGAEPVAVPIPDGARAIVGRRMSRLLPAGAQMLGVAAVIGRNFTVRELVAAAGTDLPIAFEHLASAGCAGLVERVDEDAHSYRFTHALIRESIYEGIPALERMHLHRRVGDALAAVHAAQIEPLLTRLAYHYREFAPLDGGRRAIEYAQRAARRAERVCAFEEVVTQCELVIEAVALQEPSDDREAARAFLMKGVALTYLSSRPDATESLLRAVKHALHVGDLQLVVDAAAALVLTTSYGPQHGAAVLLDQALAALPRGDSVARTKASAALAFALRSTNVGERVPQLVEDAIATGERLSDTAVLCQCLQLSNMALRDRPDTLAQRLRVASRYLEVAAGSGYEAYLAEAHGWQGLNLVESGLIDDFERLLGRYRSLPVAQFGIHRYYVGSSDILLALLRGEWSRAEARIEQLREIGSRTRPQDAEGVYGAQMFVLNRDLGRLRRIEPALRQAVGTLAGGLWAPGLVAIYAEADLLPETRAVLERLARDDFAALPRDELYPMCLALCAEACAKLSDATCAAAVHARLLPFAGQTISNPRAAFFGAADLYLGMTARAMGDVHGARHHYRCALELHNAIEAWPWVARSEYHYGALLVGLDDASARASGRDLLRDAEQIAARLGMEGLASDIGAVFGGDAETTLPDRLTSREFEVLQLIAIGRSNKDISFVLGISLNTVATHVRNILAKTQCANRTEIATRAIRLGFVQGKAAYRNPDP